MCRTHWTGDEMPETDEYVHRSPGNASSDKSSCFKINLLLESGESHNRLIWASSCWFDCCSCGMRSYDLTGLAGRVISPGYFLIVKAQLPPPSSSSSSQCYVCLWMEKRPWNQNTGTHSIQILHLRTENLLLAFICISSSCVCYQECFLTFN